MNRRRIIIALTCAFYALQLVLLWYWHALAPEETRTLDLVITFAVAVGIAIIDAGVARYLFAALKRAEAAYAADVSEHLERSLESYRVTAEREQALARDVGRAVDHELARAREALDQGRAAEASAHLRQSLDIASKTRTVYCDNVAIAAVLETKERQCREAGVGFEHHVKLPGSLPLPEVEMAAVFFNLIDNALHECVAILAETAEVTERSGKAGDCPSVRVSSMVQAGQLYVEVDNPCRKEAAMARRAARRDDLLREHGWGTDIVSHIAREHGGIVQFEESAGTFTATVMIPLPRGTTPDGTTRA